MEGGLAPRLCEICGRRDYHAGLEQRGRRLQESLRDDTRVRFFVFQGEIGESGTPHLQGYVEFTAVQRFGACVKILGGRAHVEPRWGTQQQAIDYCFKSGRVTCPFEGGEKAPGQGARLDIQALQRTLELGTSEAEVASEFFSLYMRYHSGITRYRMLRACARSKRTPLHVFIGPTGTGKSYAAARISGEPGDHFYVDTWPWFDGFSGTQGIIFDEFCGGIPFNRLLCLLDENPVRVQYKGGYTQFNPAFIAIVTNKLPRQWYKCLSETHFDALTRRLELGVLKFCAKQDYVHEVVETVVGLEALAHEAGFYGVE